MLHLFFLMSMAAAPQDSGCAPRTVDQAVRFIERDWLDSSTANEILYGINEHAEADLHFTVGMGIRNEFGLWGSNEALRSDCGTTDPDICSTKILRALVASLRRKADPSTMRTIDEQRRLLGGIEIDARRFNNATTRFWLRSLSDQIRQQVDSIAKIDPSMGLRVRTTGAIDPSCYTRAEFATESIASHIPFGTFWGWFGWRNAAEARLNPPYLDIKFRKACTWPERPDFSELSLKDFASPPKARKRQRKAKQVNRRPLAVPH